MSNAHTGLTARVYAALQRAGAAGVERDELLRELDATIPTLKHAIKRLARKGYVESVRTRRWRVTDKPRVLGHAGRPRRATVDGVEPTVTLRPRRLGTWHAAEADMSRARITRCPAWTHDARFQCAPGERPFGAGFAAVGLGRDVRTGGAWE